MGHKEAVEQLSNEVFRRVPDATITVDEPSSSDGSWWIDVEHSGHVASVEFRPPDRFGVSAPRGGYGEGPDVIFQTASQAADQLLAFLVTARLLERGDDFLGEHEIAASATREDSQARK